MLKFEPKSAGDEKVWRQTLVDASPYELTQMLDHHRALIDALKVEQKQIEAEMEKRVKQLMGDKRRPDPAERRMRLKGAGRR